MSIYKIPLIIDSNSVNGAVNISSNKDSFEIFFQEPIHIPKEATYCNLTVEESNIWFDNPNIVAGSNDKFNVDDGVIGATTITIPQGLYDLFTLQTQINTLLVQAGFADGLITFIGNAATGKVTLSVNAATVTIDNTIANCIATSLMGFTAAVLGPTVDPLTYYTGTNVATFNTFNYYLIASDITNQGIRLGDSYKNIITQVPIDVLPGYQIVSKPFNPAVVPCNNLIGQIRSKFNFRLISDTGNSVITDEIWGVRMTLEYSIAL